MGGFYGLVLEMTHHFYKHYTGRTQSHGHPQVQGTLRSVVQLSAQ